MIDQQLKAAILLFVREACRTITTQVAANLIALHLKKWQRINEQEFKSIYGWIRQNGQSIVELEAHVREIEHTLTANHIALTYGQVKKALETPDLLRPEERRDDKQEPSDPSRTDDTESGAVMVDRPNRKNKKHSRSTKSSQLEQSNAAGGTDGTADSGRGAT